APPILRSGADISMPRLITVADGAVLRPWFSDAVQTLFVDVPLDEGGGVRLAVPHGPANKTLLDNLERIAAWRGAVRHLLVRVRPSSSGFSARPVAAWLEVEGTLTGPWSLATQPVPGSETPAAMSEAPQQPAEDNATRVLRQLLDALEGAAMSGTDRVSPSRAATLRRLGHRLASLGLDDGAAMVGALLEPGRSAVEVLPVFVTLVAWSLSLEERWNLATEHVGAS